MRITFVLPPVDLSGGVRVVAVYAERLKRRGHEVVAVSPPHRQPTWRERVRFWWRGTPPPAEARSGPSHFDDVDVEHRELDDYRPIVAKDLPDSDLVIATWWETAEWVNDLPASKGAKVHFIQDYEIWNGQKDRVDAVCRLPLPKITPARWVKELLETQFDAKPEDVTLVPNSVDLDRFRAPPRGKQPVPTVGLTYTPFRNKGCDISIEACKLARQRLPDLQVVSFGSAAVSPNLPLPEGTQFVHCAPEPMLRDLYARCDAWLFGTRVEGFGLPILEAMACRTPVIGTPAGAAPELLASGGGVLVGHEDPPAMADAIVRVCTQPDPAWREMSEKAYRTASRYTWDDATDLFESALRAAAERARRGALVPSEG